MNHHVFIGDLDVTPAVEMVAAGDNSLAHIRAKLRELVAADESVQNIHLDPITDNVLVAYRDFGLWIPEVAVWRLAHQFVTTCPVCSLDLLSVIESNLMVIDKFCGGPLDGKARYVSCIVCDLVLQPLRVVQYVVKASKAEKKAAKKKGEIGDALMGVAVQGLEPIGILVPDLTDAGIIVRTLPPERVALFPKMWEASGGILEGYQQRARAMVHYWDTQDDLKKPAPKPTILAADGRSKLN